MSVEMAILLKRALIVFACLAAPFVIVFIAALGAAIIEIYIVGKDCSRVVDTKLAIALIEKYFQKPGSQAVLEGLKSRVAEIDEISYHSPDSEWSDTKAKVEIRAYKFRLEGSNSTSWSIAYVDACGGLDLAGRVNRN